MMCGYGVLLFLWYRMASVDKRGGVGRERGKGRRWGMWGKRNPSFWEAISFHFTSPPCLQSQIAITEGISVTNSGI
jgi:hypothetical protein